MNTHCGEMSFLGLPFSMFGCLYGQFVLFPALAHQAFCTFLTLPATAVLKIRAAVTGKKSEETHLKINVNKSYITLFKVTIICLP